MTLRATPLLAALLLAGAARAQADPDLRAWRDVPYASIAGVDTRLLSLDVYAPAAPGPHPVLVFLHGGGWSRGDKGAAGSAEKARALCPAGFVLVSANYRLAPAVTHPAQVEDVDRALAWVRAHAAEHGGDPARLALVGHSAGAHLAALAALDRTRQAAAGLPPGAVRAVVLLDGAAYDVARHVDESGPLLGRMLRQAFGDDPATWRDASPVHHAGPGAPAFLLVHAGRREASASQALQLARALRAAGGVAEVVHAQDKNHGTVNRDLGDPDDPLTVRVVAFLRAHLAGAAPE